MTIANVASSHGPDSLDLFAHSEDVPMYSFNDWELEKLLGTGGFATVYSIRTRKRSRSGLQQFWGGDHVAPRAAELTMSASDDSSNNNFHSDRSAQESSNSSLGLSDSSTSHERSAPLSRMALKTLNEKVLSDVISARRATVDLRNEVDILWKKLPHSNPYCVQLHGVSEGFFDDRLDFAKIFLLLERVDTTLDRKIQNWKQEHQSPIRGVRGFFRNPRKLFRTPHHLSAEIQAHRIRKVALGIAHAIQFLHSHRIIFRDLKPQNVGILANGQIKLFDFASAKYLPTESSTLNSRVGTLRYMAPEVSTRDKYSFSADIYSLGMVLWEICVLEKPFKMIKDKIELQSMVQAVHPTIAKIASPSLQSLLLACWNRAPEERPSASFVVGWLQEEVNEFGVQ